jgi:uncharacterized Tic20 family protein
MSDEEKDLRDKVEAEAEGEAEADVNAEDEAGVELEGQADVEAEVESEVAEPAGAALATKTEIGPTSNERTWAALAHASVLLTFILGVTTGGLAVIVGALVPLIIWLAFRDRSRFVTFHAMQSTVFQLASVLVWLGLLIVGAAILIPSWIVTILLSLVLIGLLLLPLVLVLTIALPVALVVMPLAVLVYGLYGAFEVYGGRDFRYWQVADWIENRGMKSPSTELAAQPASQ